MSKFALLATKTGDELFLLPVLFFIVENKIPQCF